MVRPLLAFSALVIAVTLSPSKAAAFQEESVCTSEMIGCSAGPQNCATLEYEVTIGVSTFKVTKFCYQPV